MSTIEHPLANGSDLVVLLCTFPSGNEWGEIAQTLLSERLCACVNQVREVASIYHWQGEVVSNREVVCMFKSTAERYPALVERLTELESHGGGRTGMAVDHDVDPFAHRFPHRPHAGLGP